jgi:hypothetical protein
VPAGTFCAWHFRCAQPWPISIEIDRWFTPGIGLVKEVTAIHGPSGRLVHRVVWSLKTTPSLSAPPSPSVDPAATAAETPPVPAAPTPRITLLVSRSRDGEPVSTFKSDAPSIFVRWSGENLPVGGVVRTAWIAEDVGDWVTPNFLVDQSETDITRASFGGRFILSRPRDGWAPGVYRLELYLDDKLLETAKVLIED